MSSASTPPIPIRPRKSSQDRPRAWYGRSVPRKSVGTVHGGQPLRRLPGQQVAEPPVRGDGGHRHVLVGRVDTEPEAEQLGDGQLAATTGQPQRGLQAPRIELDPLPAQPHQRRLELGERGHLVGGEGVVADRHVVAEVGDGAEADPGAGADQPGLGARCGGHLDPEAGRRLGPPARELDPEPGGGEGGGGLAEEAVRPGHVEAEGVRPGRPQGVVQRRIEPSRLAQLGQERLLGRADHAAEAGQRAGGAPDLVRFGDQTLLVRGLEPEPQPPGSSSRRRRRRCRPRAR